MKFEFTKKLVAAGLIAGMALAPMSVQAQTISQLKHRQATKNLWRNLGYGAGALGILGLFKHDNTLMFAGAAGALYSASRYEHDRKSQSRLQRQRAEIFSRGVFYRGHHKYVRHVAWKPGHKYFYFKRVY